MTDPIERACFWLARRPPRPWRSLAGPETADIVIVGAGLTGLWTALFLHQLDPALGIAVVEQGLAAHGASGRNAGMLSETVDHGHGLAIQHFGPAEARRLAALGERNVAELTAFLHQRGIHCDYEPTGRLMVALTPAQLDEARRTVETARGLGLDSFRLLDREATGAEIHSPLYLGAVAVAGGGILDPVKLVDGLRLEAERAGVRLWERSPVSSVERQGAGVVVRTAGGSVAARRAVLATSAYTHHLLPRVTRRFIPLYDYILVSDPLTPSQHEAIGWRHRQGVTDGRAFFNYYRLTDDDRILWGTSEAAYYPGNRVEPSCDHSPRHYAALRDSFRRHFPALEGLAFPYAWGGPICSTTRMTPYFGRALGGRLCYGLGYTGHGLGTTRLAGRILAHLALERPGDLLDLSLVRKKPFPYPPEPLRSWAVARVTESLRRVDAGASPGLLLRMLERMGIGFSS
ncbi:MAG TPA: FAD-dependent oxidoreductase [Gemmatimonadales bacterium]|jgi:glycine/D-amino acid oxidase-like deaminating enzyme|nr:FAD-dependent oxidoreductase [Gemmatimonadales bacterium]